VLSPAISGQTLIPVGKLGVGAWEWNKFLWSQEPWEISCRELGSWITFLSPIVIC